MTSDERTEKLVSAFARLSVICRKASIEEESSWREKMTADERIEGLLNAFGQTISDLPKADGIHHVYEKEHRKQAEKTAYDWHEVTGPYFDMIDSVNMLSSYICHLCDVIDRMEVALDTARRWMPCSTCEFSGDLDVCDNDLDVCTYQICDENLSDMAIGADPDHLKRETPEERNDRVGTDGQGN